MAAVSSSTLTRRGGLTTDVENLDTIYWQCMRWWRGGVIDAVAMAVVMCTRLEHRANVVLT